LETADYCLPATTQPSHGENNTGNETRLIGGEKQQRFGCIRRLAITAKRMHCVEGRQ
jgi:hypothetical protein